MIADRQKSHSFILAYRSDHVTACTIQYTKNLLHHIYTITTVHQLLSHFIIMPFERQSDQWKNARAASLQTSKKRREASSSISHLVQPQLDDDKVDTNDNLSVIRKVNR